MPIKADINRYKKQLIKRAIKHGMYENFGQKEVRKLEDKYIPQARDIIEKHKFMDLIQDFDHWAMNFNDKDLEYHKSMI